MRVVWLLEGGQFNDHRQMFNVNPKGKAFTHLWRGKRDVENIIEVNEGFDVEPSEYEIGHQKCYQFDYKWRAKEGHDVRERLILRRLELL